MELTIFPPLNIKVPVIYDKIKKTPYK